MTFVEFCDASRVVLVAGKGGVGKTTVGVALADAAARAGRNVLLLELEGHSDAGRTFGVETLVYESTALPLDPDAADRPGHIDGRHLAPDDALLDYLGGHGLLATAGRLLTTGAIEVITTAAPGIRDLLALGKVRSLADEGVADLIVVDAPASGHARSFLNAPAHLAATAASGPVRQQADAALEFLADPSSIRVMLVTLPEETPVNETIETAFALDDDVGVALGPIVVNAVVRPPDGLAEALARADHTDARVGAVAAHLERSHEQRAQIQRLSGETGLPIVELSRRSTVMLDAADRRALGEQLAHGLGGPAA